MFLVVGTIDGERQRIRFQTSGNLYEPRKRQAYFTMHTSIPVPDRKTCLSIKIIFRPKMKTRLLVIEVRNKRGQRQRTILLSKDAQIEAPGEE